MNQEKAGQFPFTRGIYSNMYKDRLWTMRQYAGFTTAEKSNKRYRYLLDQGVTGLSVAFDLPTQIGYDSDHAMALGEVGKVGVPISTSEDMIRLFKDIPLESVSTSMTINATAAILLALYIITGEKQGVSTQNLKGTIRTTVHDFPANNESILCPSMIERKIFRFQNWQKFQLKKFEVSARK